MFHVAYVLARLEVNSKNMDIAYKEELRFLAICITENLKWGVPTTITEFWLNLLKSTGHVMHQQFNIQELYVLPTLYLCVLYLSEIKQWLVPLTA